jgi:hypothetical protein
LDRHAQLAGRRIARDDRVGVRKRRLDERLVSFIRLRYNERGRQQ